MCLGVPGRIVEILDAGADELQQRSIVDFWGVRREVSLAVVDEPVRVGDHVLVHVGFAIRRIPEDEIESTLAFFAELGAEDLEGLPAPSAGRATPSEDA